MKKKVFALTMIISFICGSLTFAWQDPCLIMDNEYTYNGYALVDWEPTKSLYGLTRKSISLASRSLLAHG